VGVEAPEEIAQGPKAPSDKETKMKITLRADEANGTHTHFTVFVNDANAGQLCMREDEAASFYQIVSMGCCLGVDEFLGKGHWTKEQESDTP